MRMNAIAAVALCVMAGSAAAAECTEYTVKAEPVRVVLSHKPYAEVQAEAGNGTLAFVAASLSVTMVRRSETTCEVVYDYEPLRLVMSTELLSNQCAYEHVMAHELEHVAIYQDFIASLPTYLPPLIKALGLNEAVKKSVELVQATQQAHDSPQEYARNSTACGGAVVRAVGFKG
jgi:hypothetical protein